jgi:hypothetical protein
LTELWSGRLLEILIANPSKLYFGQEVLHCDLQGLEYDLGDMHTPYLKIEEDMEFTIVLIVKQKLEENFPNRRVEFIALFGPLKKILPDINKFYRFAPMRNKLFFGSMV